MGTLDARHQPSRARAERNEGAAGKMVRNAFYATYSLCSRCCGVVLAAGGAAGGSAIIIVIIERRVHRRLGLVVLLVRRRQHLVAFRKQEFASEANRLIKPTVGEIVQRRHNMADWRLWRWLWRHGARVWPLLPLHPRLHRSPVGTTAKHRHVRLRDEGAEPQALQRLFENESTTCVVVLAQAAAAAAAAGVTASDVDEQLSQLGVLHGELWWLWKCEVGRSLHGSRHGVSESACGGQLWHSRRVRGSECRTSVASCAATLLGLEGAQGMLGRVQKALCARRRLRWLWARLLLFERISWHWLRRGQVGCVERTAAYWAVSWCGQLV